MTRETVLDGMVAVCPHSKKWLSAARIELGLSEAEIVERVINGYVHSWHIQYEVPLNSSFASLARTIRHRINGGSNDE